MLPPSPSLPLANILFALALGSAIALVFLYALRAARFPFPACLYSILVFAHACGAFLCVSMLFPSYAPLMVFLLWAAVPGFFVLGWAAARSAPTLFLSPPFSYRAARASSASRSIFSRAWEPEPTSSLRHPMVEPQHEAWMILSDRAAEDITNPLK